MIDTKGRAIVAKAIRHLETGKIKWEHFNALYLDFSLLNFDDKGLSYIANATLMAYDPDYPQNRPKSRRDVARTILFLKSDLEYDWQDKRVKDYLIGFVDKVSCKTFSKKLNQYKTPEYEEQGDISVYPFKTQEEFEKAKKEINILGK